jgi:hypothetical protein
MKTAGDGVELRVFTTILLGSVWRRMFSFIPLPLYPYGTQGVGGWVDPKGRSGQTFPCRESNRSRPTGSLSVNGPSYPRLQQSLKRNEKLKRIAS